MGRVDEGLFDDLLVRRLTLSGHHEGLENMSLELVERTGGAYHDLGDLLVHELGRSLEALPLRQLESLSRGGFLKGYGPLEL